MTERPRNDSPEPTAAAKSDDLRASGANGDPGSPKVDGVGQAEAKATADANGGAVEDKQLDGGALPDAGDPSKTRPLGTSAAVQEPAARGAISLAVFGCTDVGQIREHNEDNFLVADLTTGSRGIENIGRPLSAGDGELAAAENRTRAIELGDGGMLLAVCDGMGGAAAGEVASQLATDIIYARMAKASGHHDRDQLALDIVEALEEAGTRILDESNNNRACRGMGTTATVAALVDDDLLLGQVGDSRAYVLRGERLVQVTRDQSLVNQLIEAGQLTEEEAENFEHSNIILQALGTADAVQVDLTHAKLHRGDVLMMCSDGLSGMIRDNDLRDTLVHVDDPFEACRVLVDDANQAGGHDNVTVIMAVFDGEGLTEPTPSDIESLAYAKYALPAWVDDRADETERMGPFDDDFYDDTPEIVITGEFEVDPTTNWADFLDERPSIPKEPGPGWSNVVIWIAVAVLVFALYYLFSN